MDGIAGRQERTKHAGTNRRVSPIKGVGVALIACAVLAGNCLAAGDGTPAEVELFRLLEAAGGDGSDGFTLSGIDPDDSSGATLSAAGDINADGFDDFLIAATRAEDDDGLVGGGGEIYLIFGTAAGFPARIELSDLLLANGGDGSSGVVFRGVDFDERAGDALASLGDMNGDGLDDFAIGAPSADPGAQFAGRSYVVFGKNVALNGGFPAEFELETLLPNEGGDGSAGFAINGLEGLDNAGGAVAAAGDMNGDGLQDLLIGAENALVGGEQTGEAYVIFGRNTGAEGNFPAEFELSSLRATNGGDGSEGFIIEGVDDNDSVGRTLSAGDVNGDGLSDAVIGAPGGDPGGQHFAGEVYVIFGRDITAGDGFPAKFRLSTLLASEGGDASDGFVILGIGEDNRAGSSVSAAEDLNGDGVDDIVIGAPEDAFGPGPGAVYVVFGRSAEQSPPFVPEFDLAALYAANGGDGSEGFVLHGITDVDRAGDAVSNAGDVNGDAVEDILILADQVHPYGEAYVVYGRSAGDVAPFPAEMALADLLPENGGDGTAGFVIRGVPTADLDSVAGIGDINADGVDDIALGSDAVASFRGMTYVVYGLSDFDSDGIAFADDNCTAVANTDQRDTDADGYGNACDADLDNDCSVNFVDLGEMKAVFFTADANADLNGDGSVNFADLGVLKSQLFLPPGPSGVTTTCTAAR